MRFLFLQTKGMLNSLLLLDDLVIANLSATPFGLFQSMKQFLQYTFLHVCMRTDGNSKKTGNETKIGNATTEISEYFYSN